MSYIRAAHLDLELVSRCSRRLIYDCTSCCHLSCQSLQRRLACSWVHLCLHSTCNIYWHPCTSDLPATEAHLWKKVPKLNLEFKKLNTKQGVDHLNMPRNDLTESENYDQLGEPWLEDLLKPTHSSL